MEKEFRVKLLYQISAGIIRYILIKGIFGSGLEGDFIIETLFKQREFA